MTGNRVPDTVLDRVTDLLHRQIGLRPDPNLRGRLRRCVRDDAAARGNDVETYVAQELGEPDALQSLVNRVTVQETAFFRHAEQFDVLAQHILPALPTPVTVWSAGCANGQEAFSIAMLLDELGIDGSVVATDLSTAAVARAAAGRYTRKELTGLSAQRIARHLTAGEHGWQINRSLRERVTVSWHNLMDGIPPQALGCQVVFCRNVLIYFSPEHARAFVDTLADRLPSAVIVLGSAEAMWPMSDRYETVHVDGTFIYRRRTATREPHAAPTRHTTPALRARAAEHRARPAPAPRPARSATNPAAPKPRVAEPANRAANDVAQLSADDVAQLSATGQQATAAGDHAAAVIAFRKCAYLTPEDPLAHLHLALALEAGGDRASAHRAFVAARHALVACDPSQVEVGAEGYTTADLLRLLDTKLQVLAR